MKQARSWQSTDAPQNANGQNTCEVKKGKLQFSNDTSVVKGQS